MKFEKMDTMVLAFFGGVVLFVAIVIYTVFAPEDSDKADRDAANAAQLGFIWGQIEVAEARCPQLIINGVGARQILTKDAGMGESGLSVMTRLAQTSEWFNAYKKGSAEAETLLKGSSTEAFCQAMSDAYGEAGTRAPLLLKERKEGEARPRVF